jgi:hypothetical protein
MRSPSKSVVTIILDGEFGKRLDDDLDVGPMWIVDSPTNMSVVHRIRRQDPSVAISIFRYDPSLSAAATLDSILPVVDLHHGRYSQSPPYRSIRVIGCRPNDDTRAVLTDHEFDIEEVRADCFVAVPPVRRRCRLGRVTGIERGLTERVKLTRVRRWI